jgi:hypothetical protein
MKYKILIELDDFSLVAEGPVEMSKTEYNDVDGESNIYLLSNVTVESKDGKVLAPIFEKLEVFESGHHRSFGNSEITRGYRIVDGSIFFEYDGLYKLLNINSDIVSHNSFKEIRRNLRMKSLSTYFGDCEDYDFMQKAKTYTIISDFAALILDFQKDYKTNVFNKTKIDWDGKTLKIKV